MTGVFSFILCALVTLSVYATPAPTPAPLRIMPLGDSITFGSSYAGSYRIALQRLLDQARISHVFVGSHRNGPPLLRSQANEGHSGWTIAGITSRVHEWMTSARPDVVLLVIGTNDLWVRPNLPEVPALDLRMQNLIDLILRDFPNAKLVVGSVPFTSYAWNSYVIQFNTRLRTAIAARRVRHANLYFVDIYASLRAPDLPDRVHPSAAGYDKMAAAWMGWFRAHR